MSRAQRLLELRRYRYPVSGAQLADEVGISLRTLYRDIETLRSQGAVTDGIIEFELIEERYSRRRAVLLKEWRNKEGISLQ